MPTKQGLLNALPIRETDLTIREWQREDLDELANWPSYPPGFEGFNLGYASMTREERDVRFRSRSGEPARIVLTADHRTQVAIAYLSLIDIDWQAGMVGNMGFRVHPLWCDRGVGTRILVATADWGFSRGLTRFRLDVAASNARAARCYDKAGFTKTGEFWQEDEGLRDIDLSEPRFDSVRPHVRLDGEVPQLRFYWMELTPS